MSLSDKINIKSLKSVRLPSFPLLVKELIELSNKSRTYSVRIFYAAAMYGISVYIYLQTLSVEDLTNGFGLIGTGGNLFMSIYVLQLIGICLFVPAITCNVITAEKESGNFPLLMVTRMGPGKIILEKLFSRIIHFGTVLLLALPLMAFAYVLGGVRMQMIWESSILLFLCMLQLASFSIMCSSFCRTNMAAFIMTYFLGVMIMVFIPFITILVLESFRFFGPASIGNWIYVWFSFVSAPIGCAVYTEGLVTGMASFSFTACAFGMLFSSVVYLLLARRFLVTRAFLPTGSATLRLFKGVDSYMKRVNENKLTRGIVLIDDGDTLPEENPVSWRETSKTALGATRYLIRLLVAIELPLCIYLAFYFGLSINQYAHLPMMYFLYFLFWGLAVILIIAKAANLLAGEQANQTLDVLLTTPIPTQDILRQKFKGIKRLFWVLAIPILTIAFVQSYYAMEIYDLFRYATKRPSSFYQTVFYELLNIFVLVSAIPIYFHIVMYLTLWISLQLKKNLRTIILTILVIAIWILGPYLLLRTYTTYYSVYSFSWVRTYLAIGLSALNPIDLLTDTSVGYEPKFKYIYLIKMLVSVVGYFIVMLFLKKICYRRILKELKRPEGTDIVKPDHKEDFQEKSTLSVEPV